MEENKEGGANEQPKDIPPVELPKPENNGKEGVKKDENKSDYSNENNSTQKCPQPFIVKMDSNKGWKRTEIISGIGILLSTGAIIMTVFSFQKTRESVAISSKALSNAEIKDIKSAYHDSIKSIRDSIKDIVNFSRDTAAFNLSKRDIEERSKRDNASLALNKKSIDAQLQSISETQRQFNLVNQPFLQIQNPILLPLKIGKPYEITYELNNISDIPVKVISQKTLVSISIDDIPIEEISKKFPYNSDKMGLYLIKGNSIMGKISEPKKTLNGYEVEIINDKYFIYVARKIKYENLVTKGVREYFIYFKVKPITGNTMFSNNTYFQFLYNENYDEK